MWRGSCSLLQEVQLQVQKSIQELREIVIQNRMKYSDAGCSKKIKDVLFWNIRKLNDYLTELVVKHFSYVIKFAWLFVCPDNGSASAAADIIMGICVLLTRHVISSTCWIGSCCCVRMEGNSYYQLWCESFISFHIQAVVRVILVKLRHSHPWTSPLRRTFPHL